MTFFCDYLLDREGNASKRRGRGMSITRGASLSWIASLVTCALLALPLNAEMIPIQNAGFEEPVYTMGAIPIIMIFIQTKTARWQSLLRNASAGMRSLWAVKLIYNE